MNEPGTTDRDDLFLCPDCDGDWTWDCMTCNGAGVIDRATLDERREDAAANDENWKDAD